MNTLTLQTDENIATVTLCRPEVLNAMNHDARVNLAASLRKLEDDPDVAVVVLRGEGRAFCAGQDQRESAAMSASEAHRRIETYGALYEVMRTLSKPIVAQIHGYAAGAGFQIALMADVRIAAATAQFGMTELNIGSPCILGSSLLTSVVGEAAAKYLILSAQFIPAQDALRIGAVHEVVDDDALEARVRDFAKGLAARSGTALTLTRQWWDRMSRGVFDAALQEAIEAHERNFAAGTLSDGARAFLARKAQAGAAS